MADAANARDGASAAWGQRLRYRLGVWLLKPHWLPLLEQKNEAMRTCGAGEDEARRRERLTYIAIGIKETIGVGGWRG